MKDTLEIDGHKLKSLKLLREQYGITWGTLNRWTKLGFISPTVRLGRSNYYDVREIEKRILSGE